MNFGVGESIWKRRVAKTSVSCGTRKSLTDGTIGDGAAVVRAELRRNPAVEGPVGVGVSGKLYSLEFTWPNTRRFEAPPLRDAHSVADNRVVEGPPKNSITALAGVGAIDKVGDVGCEVNDDKQQQSSADTELPVNVVVKVTDAVAETVDEHEDVTEDAEKGTFELKRVDEMATNNAHDMSTAAPLPAKRKESTS